MPHPPLPTWPQLALPCAIAPTPTGALRVSLGAASLHILNLDGSLAAQAHQVGEQVGPQAKATLRHLATALERTLQAQGAPLPLSLRTLLQPLTTRPLLTALGPDWDAASTALARAAALSPRDVQLAHIAPELVLWAKATLHRLRGTRSPAPCPAPLIGCTSAIARAPAADQLYHARNLDLSDAPSWGAGATASFITPDSGLRYLAIGTAGLLGAGLSAMNSAGLTLAAHNHLPAHVHTRGAPIFALTERIMRGAHSIAQAVDIARRSRPAATWTLVMTEGDTGRAAALEIGPDHERLYTLDPSRAAMAYTNTAWDPQLNASLLDAEPAWRRASLTRLRRARQLLFERDQPLDRLAMLSLLGDQRGPDSPSTRLGPAALCGVQTAASVLFEPAERRAWVGLNDGSPAHGLYIPLSLDAGGLDPALLPIAPQPAHSSSPTGRSQALWRAAWESDQHAASSQTRAAMLQIEHALALTPEEPDLQALAGLLAMREGRGARAEGALKRALELEPDPERRAELGYMLALAMELHGLSGAASIQLQQVIAHPNTDPITRDLARQARWARPRAEQLRAASIDMLYANLRP